MELYYSTALDGDRIRLDETESRHLVQVLRHRIGETVMVTDGKGNLYHTTLSEPDPKGCWLQIDRTEKAVGRSNYRLRIAIAPTKNTDRLEWFLEKATEIGIDAIYPVICRHSERRDLRTDRLNKILVSAMKQSAKCYLPELHELQPLKEILQQQLPGRKFICSMDANTLLKDCYTPGEDALLLIGPEGDFHPDEVRLAAENGFTGLSLGKSRLRTETAALFACSAVALMNQ